MKNKQTATEYFYDRVISIFTKYHEEDVPTIDFGELITEAFEQAKAMERQQINEAYWDGVCNWDSEKSSFYWEQYYTKTFES